MDIHAIVNCLRDHVRAQIVAGKLTQKMLAQRAQCGAPQISRWLAGKRSMSVHTLHLVSIASGYDALPEQRAKRQRECYRARPMRDGRWLVQCGEDGPIMRSATLDGAWRAIAAEQPRARLTVELGRYGA